MTEQQKTSGLIRGYQRIFGVLLRLTATSVVLATWLLTMALWWLLSQRPDWTVFAAGGVASAAAYHPVVVFLERFHSHKARTSSAEYLSGSKADSLECVLVAILGPEIHERIVAPMWGDFLEERGRELLASGRRAIWTYKVRLVAMLGYSLGLLAALRIRACLGALFGFTR